MAQWLFHVDLDQFVVAVEVRRRPELRGRPVIVGGSGDPTQRRMVAAGVSYEAREFGIHAGMPLRAALRRCPDAVFLPTDREAYSAASAEVMAVLRSFPVTTEVWGWDEAFLGVETDGPEVFAAKIQQAMLAQTGLACTVGIGDTKERAKLATGLGKPAGIFRLTATNWSQIMGDRPVTALWGVGKRSATALTELGFRTVAELAEAKEEVLAARFGPINGPRFRTLARGGNSVAVTAEPWVPRSRSHEATFPVDLVDRAEIVDQVTRLAREVADEVIAEGRTVVRVAVKVRNAAFHTQTRIMKLSEPTQDRAEVIAGAQTVLERFPLDRPVRLLGVRAELLPP